MKKLLFGALAVLALGAGCSGGASADPNNIDAANYSLSVPDSVAVTETANGYNMQNFVDGADLVANSYYITIEDGMDLPTFMDYYPDATETTLGDAAVWSAVGYDSGDDIWTEDAYYNDATSTIIVEHYTEPQGIVLAELLVGAINWK